MRLKSFRVRNFRSVDDSGPIEADNVTALIGINESGKSNLLVPLWKMRPAKDGQIKPTADYPRRQFTDFRNSENKPFFIEAVFSPTPEQARELAELSGAPADSFDEILVKRSLDGKYYVSFPKALRRRTVPKCDVHGLLEGANSEINALTPLKSEEASAAMIRDAVLKAMQALPDVEAVDAAAIDGLAAALPNIDNPLKTSAIAPRYDRLREEIGQIQADLKRPVPNEMDKVRSLALKHVPSFVYYTNYGNLDSEIYLPHVIENMKRDDLGPREEAKVRTLKVLFHFVGLEPEEILELGRDFRAPNNRQPTDDEIAAIAEKKKERSILLQSAGAKLTKEFREWWKQGEYRFRFEADGDHFRIWVSDDKRPEEVELEGRSTGLQWFLSFYLVFLVESQDAHEGSILLLDEPGTSLHPLAQKDLSAFFDGLSEENQLLYTTHSPFLIDADRLDRARKVFVAPDGTTKATPDLREGEGDDKARRASGYAVYAALGLTVAESLLLGCTTVVVEGLSDQIYLSAIKNILIGLGKIKPSREIIFPPAGGAKGVRVVASIVTGRDEALPTVLLDSDEPGKRMSKELKTSLYADAQDKILEVATYAGFDGSEIEDLIPLDVMCTTVDRWQRGPEQAFSDVCKTGVPVVDQIEAWAASHKIVLAAPAWKVDLAKRVKQSLLSRQVDTFHPNIVERWEQLFAKLLD